ncbi:hypothetical protein K501DRAFT_228929 [Backusella circina FSU 941]|nr:hypothetical protein K501DRAFT_228929 [Backusella circina FSU 941]
MYNNFHPQQQEQDKKRHPISGDIYPPHQQAPPPPYSDTASQPSAPPLMDQDENAYATYPRSYPKDNNVYPPQGYLYGALPQQQNAPPPANPNVVNWPWFSPPMIPNIPSPPPPPENTKSFCQSLTKFFVFCLFSILIMDFFKMIWFGSGSLSCSSNGILWERLPDEILFEDSLRVSTTGDGYLSSGNIRVVETNDIHTQGTIVPTIRVSPKRILEDLDYTITTTDNGTHLELHLPSQHNWRHCIHLEMTVYVPRHLTALDLNVQNTAIKTENEQLLIDRLALTTSNAMISIGSEWHGRESLALTTSNGRILLDGPKVTASGSIQLTTSNAAILTKDLVAPLVKVKTTNGHIAIDHVNATDAEIISSNAKVEVSSSHIEKSIQVKSSNAAMFVRVDQGKRIIADVKTTNGSPTLYMPLDYEGSLEAKTSSNNKVVLVDPTHWLHIRSLGKGYLMGERYESEASPSPPSSMEHATARKSKLFDKESSTEQHPFPSSSPPLPSSFDPDVIPVQFPSPFEYHTTELDKHEKFISYFPHSGFHNQRIELENALLLASYLNRTLLLPHVVLGNPAIPWLRFDKMYERLILQHKHGLEYCAPLFQKDEPVPAECLNYPRWTSVPWTFFYDFAEIKERVRIIFRPDLSFEWIQDTFNLTDDQIYTFKDNSPYEFRVYDLPESTTPLTKFINRVDLSTLEAVEETVMHFGSVFGSYRVLAQSTEHQELLKFIRRNMIFKNPTLLASASRVVSQLGGVGKFVGIHLRVGDGLFRMRASITIDDIYHQLVNDFTDLTVQEVKEYDPGHDQDRLEDTGYEVRLLRDASQEIENPKVPISVQHPASDILEQRLGHLDDAAVTLQCQPTDGRNDRFARTIIYIATDCPHPRSHPLLQKIVKTFPCVFFLDDFMDSVSDLKRLQVAEEGVKLESYLIPMVDAMIASQGHTFFGTNSSTFSSYIERQLHPVYTGQTLELLGAPLP